MSYGKKEPTETVVHFKITLNWDQWHTPGINAVDVTVEGCTTSSQAIDKAIEIVRPLREDRPKRVSAQLEEFERPIPKQVGNGSTVRLPPDAEDNDE